MAVYAVGDIQGCYDELRHLLDQIRFDPGKDRLWFTGDLVNRGHKSLEVLRFVRRLGKSAVAVLGNHDLHLLATASGTQPQRKKDTFHDILQANDRDELLTWLRHRPLLHRDERLNWTMVHAGLPPQWDIETAQRCAGELEAVLRGDEYRDFFSRMYGDGPARWVESLKGWKRLRFITNSLTRLRYCDAKGRLALDAKGRPGTQGKGFMPWFAVPGRKSRNERIVFGHWSTLGYYAEHRVHCLDTGCVWGGRLTALRLDGKSPERFSVDCPTACKPGAP
ncbi:MAG: symmetrical bis(5'-nucleosyl)-tetraphosphatase [Gammaproteobacteria bacterium]